MRWIRNFTLAVSLAALGCGGGSDDDDNGNPTGPPPSGGATNGTFTVSINGVIWSATGTVTVNRGTNNFIGLAGTGFAGSAAYAVVVGIANATGPGPHNLDVFAGGDGSSIVIGGTTTGWGTAFQGGNGTITIESITANRIVGRFNGTAIVSSGNTAPLTLVGGRFDITF
jgi:hypothetical protein